MSLSKTKSANSIIGNIVPLYIIVAASTVMMLITSSSKNVEIMMREL